MDSRFTVCRAVYEADFPTAIPVPTGVCRWVCLRDPTGPLHNTEVEIWQTNGNRVVREGSSPGTVIGHAFLGGTGAPYQVAIGKQFPGGGLLVTNGGTRVVEFLSPDGMHSYRVTFDLGQGGIITSFERDGSNMLQGGTKGIEVQAVWTDTNQTGEFVRHDLVQGSDRWGTSALNRRGGIVRAFSHTPQDDGSHIVGVEFYPIVQFSDGTGSVPGISRWHGGSEYEPVYAFGMPMTITHQFHLGGVTDLHRSVVTFENNEEAIQSAYFDMSLYVAFYPKTPLFTRMQAYDGTSSTDISEVDRRHTMDNTVIKADDEGSTSASLISTSGYVTAKQASEFSPALAVGGTLSADSKTLNRRLGDIAGGNGWSWNNHTTDRLICYGQWLTNRIHSSTVQRTIPAGNIAVTRVNWATGFPALNESLVSLFNTISA